MKVSELVSVLRTAKTIEDIEQHREEILDLIPDARIIVGYDQQNRTHQYDLWEHSLHTVMNLPKDLEDDMVYLAALLYDIGKPDCQSVDYYEGNINMHYYGHPERSEEIVRERVIPLLDLPDDEKRRLLYYVRYHDDRVSLRIKHLRRHLNMGASLEEFQTLMHLEVADAKAHVMIPVIEDRIEFCGQWAGEYGKKAYMVIVNESKNELRGIKDDSQF